MRRQYNVYIRQRVDDYTEDPEMALHYEDFVGKTWAVSAAQAANNVRFRNGDKYNCMLLDSGAIWYYAVAVGDDRPELHQNYKSWVKTH